MPEVNGTPDPNTIKSAFATDEEYAVRSRIHEMYSRPQIDFRRWVLDTQPWRGDERVLDIGAGPGSYFEQVRERSPKGTIIAGDLSTGMVERARKTPVGKHVRLLSLDAQNLPFPDASFDVVLANHMLYHVPEIARAISEIRRVLRDEGYLIAATNSENTIPELETLARRACTLLGYPKQEMRPAHNRFTLENGSFQLAHYFYAVARYDIPSAFHFPEVDPVLDYLNSLRPLRELQLPQDVSWADFMDVMEKQISRLIRHFGELQVHKLSGVLVATNGGGFAADYISKLNP